MPKATTAVQSRRNTYRTARPQRVQNALPQVERPNALMNAVVAEQKGLPSLPLELHLEILSYLACQPIPYVTFRELSDSERFGAIFALSRTCRALHSVYNPLFWRIVEARGWRRGIYYGTSYAAPDLLAYVRVLTREAPHLSAFVQVFNVELTCDSSKTVYRELARCLPCLPNLHTFQVMEFPPGGNSSKLDIICLQDFEDAFARMAPLSQVHTLTLPTPLLRRIDIKRIFPSLRHVSLHEVGWPAGVHKIPPAVKLIPRDIHTLNLPNRSVLCQESKIKYLASLFPDLRVTPRLSLDIPMRRNGDDFRSALKKALQSVLNGWRRVSTIQFEDQPSPQLWEGERFIEKVKEALQHNLSLEENQDVVAGEIRIWQWRHSTPPQVISVPRRVEDD